MKIPLVIAGVVLVGTSLAACSGGDDDGGGKSGSYCKEITSAKPVFESLAKGELEQLEKGFQTFHTLADSSPDSLKKDWKVLDDAATSIEKALKESGIKLSDLAGIQSGKIPEGVDVTKLASFATDLQKLNNADFTSARNAISKQAKDTCGVELGGL